MKLIRRMVTTTTKTNLGASESDDVSHDDDGDDHVNDVCFNYV